MWVLSSLPFLIFFLPLMCYLFLYKGSIPDDNLDTAINPYSQGEEHSVYLRNWPVNIALL